jgi:hypothetical protein
MDQWEPTDSIGNVHMMPKDQSNPPCIHMILEINPRGQTKMGTLNHVCIDVGEENLLWTHVKAFDHAINTANRQTLKPKKTPNLHGVRWWNKECSVA